MIEETELAHKKVIMETFSQDSVYWRKVYDETWDKDKVGGLIQGGALVNREMVDRKNAVLEFVDRFAGHRKVLALDLGCGAGMTMNDLLKRGHAVVGVDIAEGMLDQAKSGVSQSVPGRAQCILSDVEKIPFKDDSFDVIICMGVLQYLQTDQKVVGEIGRVVRDGGLVIITLPNYFRMNNVLDPYYYLVRGIQFLVQKSPLSKKGQSAALSPDDFSSNRTFANRRYYYGQLSNLFASNHLSCAAVRGIGFGPLTLWRKQLLPTSLSLRINRFLQRIALKTSLSFLNVFANRWVICLIKGNTQLGAGLLNVRAARAG